MDKSIMANITIVDNRFVDERSTEEVVGIVNFTTQPAMVRRGYGLTLNLGNYSSARIDVSIEVPCYLADVNKADAWAASWVEKRIAKEAEDVRSMKPDNKPQGHGGDF